VFRRHQYERLVTSGFLHADVVHLLFNVIAMYSVAMYVEAAAGTTGFLMIYFGSLLRFGPHSDDAEAQRPGVPGARCVGSGVRACFSRACSISPSAKVALLFLPIPMPWPVFAVLFIAASVYGAQGRNGTMWRMTCISTAPCPVCS
jgi:membrane associated rhomboid family serine protease